MAEAIMKKAVENDEQLAGKVEVSSAGISAFEGDFASEASIKVLRENMGIDISSHRAKRVTGACVKDADLILTMTRGHRDIILSAFPWARGKVFTLKEYIGDTEGVAFPGRGDFDLDITDPYGMPVQTYRNCSEELKNAINRLILKIKSLI